MTFSILTILAGCIMSGSYIGLFVARCLRAAGVL